MLDEQTMQITDFLLPWIGILISLIIAIWVKDMATGMALRAVDDAICHRGLLKKAIIQLQLNFENAGQNASKTWMGRLLTVTRKT